MNEMQEYEIISVFKTTIYDFKYYNYINFNNEEEFDTFFNKCKELSFYNIDKTVKYGDKFITLSTCEYSAKNGRLVVVVVIVICMIALLVSSVFGIFFSSEDTGSTITVDGIEQSVTMSQIVSDLNMEFMNKITEIQNSSEYDEYEISGSRAETNQETLLKKKLQKNFYILILIVNQQTKRKMK